MKKATFGFNINDIAEIAILCSLAIVLDQFCKIPLGATGGSINLSMLPLYIIALRHGWFKGFIGGGIIYAVTTCIIDGYGFQFFPLEYFVAYGSVGILGIFANFIYKKFNKDNKYNIIIAYSVLVGSIALAAVIRFFCGSIDSVIFYEYSWAASFAYNAPYVFISAAVVCAVMCALLPAIKLINHIYPSSYIKNSQDN
ncbi:MAG: ECF transporter S component [Bacilli bacterium]|jgi:membrane protein